MRDWPGHGAPLIHAPDPLVPSRLADRLAAGLAPSHRVLSVAPRAGVPYQVAAADLVGVLKQFGFLKPVLVGERLGCLSVVILAAWYPELVWRAILVEPTWQASDRESDGESGRETDGESIEARALRECPPDQTALRARVTCEVLEMSADEAALVQRVEAFVASPLP